MRRRRRRCGDEMRRGAQLERDAGLQLGRAARGGIAGACRGELIVSHNKSWRSKVSIRLKDRINRAKHGISLAAAAGLIASMAIVIEDRRFEYR